MLDEAIINDGEGFDAWERKSVEPDSSRANLPHDKRPGRTKFLSTSVPVALACRRHTDAASSAPWPRSPHKRIDRSLRSTFETAPRSTAHFSNMVASKELRRTESMPVTSHSQSFNPSSRAVWLRTEKQTNTPNQTANRGQTCPGCFVYGTVAFNVTCTWLLTIYLASNRHFAFVRSTFSSQLGRAQGPQWDGASYYGPLITRRPGGHRSVELPPRAGPISLKLAPRPRAGPARLARRGVA